MPDRSLRHEVTAPVRGAFERFPVAQYWKFSGDLPNASNVFARETALPATVCYCAWGCFRYFWLRAKPRRPCERRDPYAVPSMFCTMVVNLLINPSPNSRPGLWVPAFAGTTVMARPPPHLIFIFLNRTLLPSASLVAM